MVSLRPWFTNSPPRPGGRLCKNVQYMVKVVASSSDQAKVGLFLDHGPDGTVSKLHSTPIALTQLTGGNALLLVGDSDSTKIIGEFLHPVVNCLSNDANACWALVEIFEMRKPFYISQRRRSAPVRRASFGRTTS